MLKRLLERFFPELADDEPAPAERPFIVMTAPPVGAGSKKANAPLMLGTHGHGTHDATVPYPIPFKIENRHFLLGGTPGSGKTRLFFQIADQARERGDKAFIVDHGGEQIKRNWRPGDIILNPFDSRWPGWNPFAECRQPWDFDAMGKMIIPDGSGSGAEWNRYAQQLVTAVLKKIDESAAGGGIANRNIADIVRYSVASNLESLRGFLGDDPIVGMLDPKNEKMVGSVRGIVSSYLAPWRYIRDRGDDGLQFSIRDWITDDSDRRWVFVTYQESMFGAVRSLISCWLSCAIMFGLDLSEDESRRIWFFLDELGSLDKIGALDDALTKVRKRGGCVVAGLQSLSQLQETYGPQGAQTLLSCFGTWVGLKCGDADTAEAFSRHFGMQEIWQEGHNEGMSHGGERANLSSGASLQLKEQRVVKYTEIMKLEDLHGFIKFPLDLPIGEITCPIQAPPNDRGAPHFIARDFAADKAAARVDLGISR